jgi:hypothetical protein
MENSLEYMEKTTKVQGHPYGFLRGLPGPGFAAGMGAAAGAGAALGGLPGPVRGAASPGGTPITVTGSS